ncbi:MAG TPA: ATP-binding cassette domain-containing protein [Anaerolineae bacterium]|nr:ATP-binding cassette domain-containing protein [Anaerolineae bacterium]
MAIYEKTEGETAVLSPGQQEQINQTDSTEPDLIIRLQNVGKVYQTGSGDFTALKDISLDIAAGEFLGIIGKSGAGKTTLLNMIAGVSEITSGEVWFYPQGGEKGNGRVTPILLNNLKEDELAAWRGQNMGVVYQSFELLPQLDLVTNIMLPQDFAGLYQAKISRERAMELLDIVELTEHAYKLPAHISGGQKQRVAIARALVNDPAIIIADEPTGSLDTVTAETIFQIFEKLVAQGKTIIMVTHDNELAPRFSQVVRIADGELVDDTAVPETVAVDTAVETPVAETEDEELNGQTAVFYRGSGEVTPHSRQNQPAIVLKDVYKTYVNAAGEFPALKGIDMQLDYGQFISIVGKSGSGKSTLLNMLTGIDHPTAGEVIIGGQNIYEMSERQRARWRGRNMGIVFQFFQLLPTLNLLENTMLPMDYGNVYPVNERPERAMELLKMVGLEDHIYDLPAAVSNGQQQSAAIARSLATDPPIIVADEPTGNLDSRSADNIIQVFQHLADRGKTILIVTHDPSLTSRTDQTVIISDGEIIDETIANALPLLDHPLMLHATRHAEKKTYAPGEIIVQQGQPVTDFYMVAEGAVDVVIDSPHYPETVLATLGKNQFFGEVELVGDKNAIATVRAAQDKPVTLSALPQKLFYYLLDQSPPVKEELKHVADTRHQENITGSKRVN